MNTIAWSKAEAFLEDYTLATRGVTEYPKVLKLLEKYKTKHGFVTVSVLTTKGEKIGSRYVFDDNSFCDFYDNTPQKAFTGVNHDFKFKA